MCGLLSKAEASLRGCDSSSEGEAVILGGRSPTPKAQALVDRSGLAVEGGMRFLIAPACPLNAIDSRRVTPAARRYVGLGLALGAGIGAAMGAATGNMGRWLALGIAIGMTVGLALSRRK